MLIDKITLRREVNLDYYIGFRQKYKVFVIQIILT